MSLLKHSKRERKRQRRLERNAAVKDSLKSDFGPVLNKVSRPVIGAAKKHPKRTFIIMIIVIIVNMAALFLFTDSFHSNGSKGLDLNFSKMMPDFKMPEKPQVNYNWKNFWAMKKIRDSMKYLISKEKLSKEDTLLFIRLSERLSAIDTGFHPIIPNKKIQSHEN